jgi:heme/copper-type cytochrome/quinol oxidase subunit 1
MPRLSCWFTRAALLHLMGGFTLGALLLWHKGVPLHPQLWRLLPAHIEFLLLGWVLQLVLGVAYWILPRFQTTRRRPHLAWFAFIALNLGVWLVACAPFTGLLSDDLRLAGRVAEAAATVAFALHAWPRIKPAAVV